LTRAAEHLIRDCEQLASAESAAAAERSRYDTLMLHYHGIIASISNLVAVTTESMQKRDSFAVSGRLVFEQL